MEWIFAGLFALAIFAWSSVFLLRKLLKFGRPARELAKQLEVLRAAYSKVPEIA